MFPFELVDAVINEVSWAYGSGITLSDVIMSDGARRQARVISLATCSLVSRSWLPRSRCHLFHSIHLRGASVDRSLHFLSLLDSELSTIAPYVRRLQLEGVPWNPNWWLITALSRLSVLSVESLSMAPLSMAHVTFHTSKTKDMKIFLASFQKLRQLIIERCIFTTSPQLVGVMSASACLECIGL